MIRFQINQPLLARCDEESGLWLAINRTTDFVRSRNHLMVLAPIGQMDCVAGVLMIEGGWLEVPEAVLNGD